MGRLASPLQAGPSSRFDLGNVAIVDLAYGTLHDLTNTGTTELLFVTVEFDAA
jgi:hypothetical protein